MENVAEFIVQETDQPDMRVYNVRHELTEAAAEDGVRGSSEMLGSFGKLVVGIRGVEVVRIQPYRFFVSKAVAFTWEEVEPKIVELVEWWKIYREGQAVFELEGKKNA